MTHVKLINLTRRLCGKAGAAASAFAMALGAQQCVALESSLSGFGSIVIGRTFGACTENNVIGYTDSCTRYVADWPHAGVYTPKWSFRPESRVGLQWAGTLTDDLSVTAQVVSRALSGQAVGLEWAYLTYKFTPAWSLQVGRKRLPLYYFSDFQDAGYAYLAVRPSPDVYGWDIVNFNGASLEFADAFDGWSLRASAFGGNEITRKNRQATLAFDSAKNVAWKRIVGVTMEASIDWFSFRANYLQSDYQLTDRATGITEPLVSGKPTGFQRFYGIAANIDRDGWVVRTELAGTERWDLGYKGKFYLVNIGHRFGGWTPSVSRSGYWERASDAAQFAGVAVGSRSQTLTATLRYELTKKSAVKLQVDKYRDRSVVPFAGNARLVSASYDFVF